jgi:DNA-binding response OmpR family regulator
MDPKILIIDDDRTQLALLRLELGRKGFAVTTARNGLEGLRMAYQIRPDLVILDVMMAEMDGLTVLGRLRQVCDAPIVMLTALSSKADMIKGLSLGADDYVIKPYSPDQLLARLHTLLRRYQSSSCDTQGVYDDGRLFIDLRDQTVRRDGRNVELTPTESSLLMNLVSQAGHIVSRRELLIEVWGPEYANATNSLSTYIRYLREKIEADPGRPRYIRTRRAMGYYFAGCEGN